MELVSMRLINFQCFKDSEEIPIHRMTIFIGENDSGKSCLLRALENFYLNKPPEKSIFHALNGQCENNCSIILKFRPNASEEMPKEFKVEGNVNIKKEFYLDESGDVRANLYVQRYFFKDKELNSIPSLKMSPLKDLCEKYGQDYTNVDESRAMLSKFVTHNFESLDKTVDWGIIKWPDISPILPIYEHYDSSNYGSPKNLIETTLKNIYKKFFINYDGEGNESLKPELVKRRTEIETELDNMIQESLKPKLGSIIGKIKIISGDYFIDFSAGFSLSDILVDYGQGLRSINDIGEGSKKRLFLAIMEWDKEIKAREPHKAVIRGYDEPDASLHYSAQRDMYYTLRDLSDNTSSQVQVMICTHSISMIDRAPARIMNHIKQINGISNIEYLKGDDDEYIKNFLDNVSEISGIKNSSLFFERCFIVIEGETEYNALGEIYKKSTKRSLLEDGVVLINLKGNGSWESFLKLLFKNKRKATILFLDNDTQESSDRRITPDKLKRIGFDQDFLNDNVVLVGNNEFEDIFPNDIICKCLNSNWPKVDGEHWSAEDIEPLRNSEKFSDSLIQRVRTYRYEHFDRDAEMPNKPEFGKKIAEIITVDEIKEIEDLDVLITKIKSITD